MCAIAGVIGSALSGEGIKAMLKTMTRRGPDDTGVYQKGSCTFLHSRLAIIDPDHGKQPMELNRNGEHYVLIYNGELYNSEELRHDLTREGHSFAAHSDTEIVLHAYAQWGENCVQRMNGIFGFAVWEEKAERVFLARDRIGVKPLFYMVRGGNLLFASEMKTILSAPGIPAELDEQGAAQLIMLGPGRLPGSGVFHGMQELEPGCCAVFENKKISVNRYWMLQDREHSDSFEETAECVRYLLTDSIQRQMISDVPIGTFLSGGLDSSIISAVCAAEMRSRGESLKTFSVDYLHNDLYFRPGKFQPNSDPYYIRIMQEFLGSNHKWTVLDAEELSNSLEESTEARDLPGMADVDFSLLAFCREIRKEVKVALSGECADEIFGGYPWYRDPEVRERAGFPWAQNTEERSGLLCGALSEKLNPREYVMDAYTKTCRESDILPGTAPLERRMKEMVNLNFRWFMQTLLDRKDRMSMYSGLEVRVPFCDYRIAEYLYAVPWGFKNHDGKEKGLLRYAMRGVLPEEILYRKKSPYPKTFDPQYEALMQARMDRMMQDRNAPVFALVSAEKLNALLDNPGQWPWYGQLMRRPQIMAYFLQLDFWLRHYNVSLLF